jgi:hypothetical protein
VRFYARRERASGAKFLINQARAVLVLPLVVYPAEGVEVLDFIGAFGDGSFGEALRFVEILTLIGEGGGEVVAENRVAGAEFEGFAMCGGGLGEFILGLSAYPTKTPPVGADGVCPAGFEGGQGFERGAGWDVLALREASFHKAKSGAKISVFLSQTLPKALGSGAVAFAIEDFCQQGSGLR